MHKLVSLLIVLLNEIPCINIDTLDEHCVTVQTNAN